MVFAGYWQRPDETARTMTPDGWLRTGDIGRRDADGFFFITGRIKELIIKGGENIAPREIDEVLLRHPAVQEAAVVGIASEHWGETPVAFVVLRAVADVSPEELRAWFNERVGKTQRLADLRLVEALPRSAIGKLLKRSLRDAYTTI